MKLTELLTSPWAIAPESLREIQQIYATHCKGEKIDVAAVEARLGRPLANEQQQYEVRPGGIAVLPIEGILAPKANLFMQISGGASTQMLSTQIQSAMADTRVKGLVLAVDSPGGSVFGTPELAAVVQDAAQQKPVVTVCDATIASAAYWVGSAANAVYLSGPTVQAGSIGIVARMGLSRADPDSMEFTRGKYKRGSVNGAKPDGEFMAYYEAQLDHLYSVFVDTVAQHRGATSAQVLQHMADGRVFIGQQAIDAGLADGFATVDAIVEAMATNPQTFAARKRSVFAMPQAPGKTNRALAPAGAQATGAHAKPEPVLLTKPKGPTMDREEFAQQHPQLFATLQSEFAAAGAAQERERIQAVMATAEGMPGHEKLVHTMAFDGATTAGAAAMAVLTAERNVRSQQAQAMASDAPKPLPQDAPPAVEAAAPKAPETAAEKHQATMAHAAASGCDYLTAYKALGFR